MRKVYWNNEWETYEYVYDDGYVHIFRDDIEAKAFADEHNLEFEENP
jgi:hypothetical protein